MSDLVPPTFDPADAAAAAERFAATARPDVAYAVEGSPLGQLLLATTPKGLVRISYCEFDGGVDAVLDDLAQRVSRRILEAPGRLDAVRRELDEYFAGGRTAFDVPIDWALTAGFGRRILRATAAIPFGAVSTYAAVAAKAGSPRGTRAAGNALGGNPIPIVIPCHRVLRTGGALGGYTGGLEKKERLLAIEGVQLG
jgi:methylated-DNA-[protein]-cysteine S-methyltransferase